MMISHNSKKGLQTHGNYRAKPPGNHTQPDFGDLALASGADARRSAVDDMRVNEVPSS